MSSTTAVADETQWVRDPQTLRVWSPREGHNDMQFGGIGSGI